MARIEDLGVVTTATTLDRSDGDFFKMSTSGNLAITFSDFEDGDFVTFAVENSAGAARSLTISNPAVLQFGSGGISVNTGNTIYMTFLCFDGSFVETFRNHT